MTPSEEIDRYITTITDWRGQRLAELRELINETAPQLQETWKWGVPVWKLKGNICAISAFKDYIKINFFKGASIPDPNQLLNSGLDSKDHRSINFAEASQLDKASLKELLLIAISADGK